MLNFPVTAAMSLPVAAGVAIAGVAAAALGWGMFVPQSRLLGSVISHGPRDGPLRIALTFDDGPWPGSTDAILDSLGESSIKATFFIIGRHARRWPDLLRRMHDQGHLIGNHTFDHHRCGLFGGPRYWRSQITRTDDVIAEVTGKRPGFFRAPMGFKSPPLMRAVTRSGHRMIAWSRRGRDGVRCTPQRIIESLNSPMRAGEIVLLHDGRDPASRREVSATARALAAVIANLRSQGVSMVRVDELIGGC